MSTMSAPGPILRELHRLLKHARDLQTRIAQAPKTLLAYQTKTRKQEELLHQAQERLKKLKVATHEKEGEIKTKRQQIDKYEKQLNDITSKKEFDALKHEIATAQAAIRELEDEILAEMEEAEQQAAGMPEIEKATKLAQAELTDYDRGTAERLASFSEQRRQTLTELARVEATLSPELKAIYERPVKAKGDDALSHVENRTCGTCYCDLTAQNYNELKSGRIVCCQGCGRILYLME